MALNPRTRDARRSLVALITIILAMAGFMGIAHYITRDDTGPGKALLTPKLGLDLEGGTEMVLTPVLQGDAQVNEGQLEQAVNIIRQRIDANGVAETEITTLGGRNVVISIPGQPTKEQLDAVSKPTQLSFRAVLAVGSGVPLTVSPTATGTPATTTAPSATTKPAATTKPPGTTPAATSKTAANAPVPQGLAAATTAPPAPAATAKPTAKPTTTAKPATPAPVASTIEVQGQQWTPGTPLLAGMVPTPTSSAAPTNGSDVNWVTPAVIKAYNALDCSKKGAVDALVDDPTKPFVTCSDDGGVKYILGPVEVFGKDIADATSGFKPGPNGQPTSEVEVNLKLNSEGATAFAAVSKRLLSFGGADATTAATTRDVRNQFGIVLDKYVISAPTMNALIPNGQASITGSFTLDSGKALAQQLKFGALPMSFTLKSQDSITPTLGGEQLRIGLLAGLVGFLLVIVYSLFQYRALGFVTVASLAVAAILTYLAVTLLGFATNYRLTMAGVTGLIVAIGVTADSFIVYFERIRDEVRDGRSLVAAVETGWKRARRTIIAADFVNFLAAAVLYLLASDKVRGFAFTLGLTTIIDLVVVILFTHPVVSMLAHTKFFGGGHRWSGLDPERLGADAKFRYAGRGRFVMPEPEPEPEPRRKSNYPGADAEGAVL